MPADPHSAYARARDAALARKWAIEDELDERNYVAGVSTDWDETMMLDAILRAYHASLEADGLKTVPVEATTVQLAAAQTAWLADDLRRTSTLYRACVAAAPAFPPETEGKG